MPTHLIFWPVLLQVSLTILVFLRLQLAKSQAARAGLVDASRRALHEDAWPDSVRQINNNIRNQFEVPVLFYVLVGLLWALNAAGPVAQLVAWLFAVSRVAHAYVHTGSNDLPLRRRIFTIGVLLLVVLVGLVAAALLRA